MLGKTNAIYIENADMNELTLHFEVILTDLVQDIKEIYYLNGMYFVFFQSGKVMYGEMLTELKYLKNGENYIESNYVIYCENHYVFSSIQNVYEPTNSDGTGNEACHYLYKTSNLVDFQTVEINLGIVKQENCININGLFLNSKGKIIVLLSERPDKLWLGMFDNIADIKAKSDFTLIQRYEVISFKDSEGLRYRSKMYKDYIFIRTSENAYGSYAIISPEGMISYDALSNKAEFLYGDIYLKSSSRNEDLDIYFSYNGTSWKRLGTLNDVIQIDLYAEYDENALGMFIHTKDKANFFVYAETFQNIISSYENKVTLEEIGLNGDLNCSLKIGGYTYIGSNGGVIYKTWVDYSSTNVTPDISILKALSAKQALMEANKYTDHKYAELEKRIALLELKEDTNLKEV